MRLQARRSSQRSLTGFTLIELLIVIAIIGIISALLVPNLLDAIQKAKQKATMADLQFIGTAWFSWYSDQVASAAAGQQQATVPWNDLFNSIDEESLRDILVPQYAQEIPADDGWGDEYEYGVASQFDTALPFGARSSGSDGVFDSNTYTVGTFLAREYAQDIVWVGGVFIRRPGGGESAD